VVDLATINGETEDFEGRHWLEGITRDNKPVGWDLEWQPDRTRETDNPIALMQFADENIALLLRTHRTRNWLPISVMRALMSDSCKKVQVGWDGPDRQKMQNTFNFQPLGIVDMAELAKVKGIAAQGLKSLSDHFGMKMQKDSKIARSDWASEELTLEQKQYAAEDAYFSFMVYQKLSFLSDAPLDRDPDQFKKVVNQGVLELRPGWEEQGIARKHDGLWCTMCNKGPMTVPEVMVKHMEGAKHKKNWEQRKGVGVSDDGHLTELPDEYTLQCIVQGDGCNGMKAGDFKCTLCNVGPFSSLATVDAHIKSKKHVKGMTPVEPQEQAEEAMKKDPLEGKEWNLPDYVTITGDILECTLCPAKANAYTPMANHLGGDKHAKKCRSSGHPEVMWVKERLQLEDMLSGKPVVRKGFRRPKREKADLAMQAQAAQQGTAATAPGTLPEGWQEFADPASGHVYYYHAGQKVSQWERPAAASQESQQQPQQQQPQVAEQSEDAAGAQEATRDAAEEQEPEAAAETDPEAQLPPGWQAVWSDETGAHYYADAETQTSQWEKPPPYVALDWARHMDPAGRAYWRCKEFSFYETEDDWQRFADKENRVYWSNATVQQRFFEPATVNYQVG